MPDHLHLVLEGMSQSSDFRHFAKVSKQRVDYVFRTQLAIRTTWQEGYYDRVLRPEEDPKAVARYIIENPVRAGLVTDPRDYPYLGSDVWTLDQLLDSLI